MEMFALIKKNDDIKLIKSCDIEKEADKQVRSLINIFLDYVINKYGENYKINLKDLEVIRTYNNKFSDYTIDNVLKKIFNAKRCDELGRLLTDLFEGYDLNSNLISDIKRSLLFSNVFYVDGNGSLSYKEKYVDNYFKNSFGYFIGEDLIKKLKKLISSFEYNINYSASELEDYIFSCECLVKTDRKNFENLLYLFGEISDPKLGALIRHKCYNCDNLSPLLCEKAKANKKTIDDYSFINQGYQVFITTNYKDLNMVSFIVEDCNDYKSYNDDFVDKDEYSYVKRMRK